MSPMPEYSDDDLSPTEPKSFSNSLSSDTKISISAIVEENGTSDNNETQEAEKVYHIDETSDSDNQNGNISAEVGVEITESDNIIVVSMQNVNKKNFSNVHQ